MYLLFENDEKIAKLRSFTKYSEIASVVPSGIYNEWSGDNGSFVRYVFFKL